MPDLLTRWGRELDPDHVLPEHPRPQLVRDSYLNLNGWWSYAITPATMTDTPGADRWDGRILVPFSPEAPLSGVGRQVQPDEHLWYHRTLELPDGFTSRESDRVLLHFGAVDQACTVWINGVRVARHRGGYLPFSCDVTDALRPEANDLVVRVRDLSDGQGPSSGKQRLRRGNIWYTAQSGIWQTVWLEAVPTTYVERLTLVPLLEQGAVEVTVHGGGAPAGRRRARVTVSAGGAEVARTKVAVGRPTVVPLGDVRPWSPEDPFLYDVEVSLGKDVVRSYVGIRSFGAGPDENGVPRLLLNGKPYLHVGVLDQGYWPDGLLTAPSDEALVLDIETMKDLGFTMLRKHIKVEPLRWYHHCDRLGMLVWQDFVNGGGRYKPRVMKPPELRRMGSSHFEDDRYKLFARDDPRGRKEFLREARRTVDLLRNVTSLAVWVPFNEGWGQFDANAVTELVRTLDDTRSIDHASGWHDQGGGDLWSLHVYGRPFVVPTRSDGDERVLALTEYGGYDLEVPGHTWGDKQFGYRRFETADDLRAAFVRLHTEELGPAVSQGLAAVVYTQVSDVEDEVNGLMTYDREVVKLPASVVRDTLAELRLD